MTRYFLRLAYRGAPFHGWQSQPNAVSVQSVMEDALTTLARERVKITGAGRTDAGVNATEMYAHLDLTVPIDDIREWIRRLNALIGRDIAVYGAAEMAPGAHARFDATSRTYHYRVYTCKSPFLYPLAWQAPATLDFEAMNEAASMLIGKRDFTSFSKLHTDVKTNICDLRRAEWVRDPDCPEKATFIITADRFLRNMVRAVVGTLVDVGRGKLSPAAVMEILERKDRCAAGTSMPAQALFLHNITYPYPVP